MGQIEQTYAWSNSRVKCLRECMWRYNLIYHTAWNGWLTSAPQDKKQAYMLKNLTSLPMWVGSIVHDIIEEIISSGRLAGEWITLEEAQQNAVQRLRQGWKQSTEKKWQGNPKQNVNLAEHFYKEEISQDRLATYKQKVLKSLKAFYDMPLFQIIKDLPDNAWLTIEDFAKFRLDTEEEIAVKIDAGFRYKDKVFLLDWKTGMIDDRVIEQLVTYSMYALKQGWVKKPEDIVVIPVYLAAWADVGAQATPHLNITMAHIKRQADIIRKEYPLLQEAFENKDNPDYFKKTDNENVCKRCFFRDVCSGTKIEIEDGETPF